MNLLLILSLSSSWYFLIRVNLVWFVLFQLSYFYYFLNYGQYNYQFYYTLERMSRFRASPSSRSPFRSPPRLYQTQRDAIIEDQIRLKNAIKAESEMRRMGDELSLLQIKARHTNQLEDKVQLLLRQNNQLSRDNDELARQLNEKRYQMQRIRAVAAEHHDREALRSGQLFETTKALELEIELTKKQRLQGNRLYEAHIQKLQRMLDQKVVQLDTMTLRCNELSKKLELMSIQFEQQRNRLKNLMTRTEHQLQRELEYTKQKTTSQKFSEIDAMKRNHAAQISILQDQISKLKSLNSIKSEQFQNQLNENKNLRKRHDEEVRLLGAQNDDLRAKMFKLEEINRSQVENIQVKYNTYHAEGTSTLKEQHSRQIKLLLDEIDKQKWLINEKNAQIQNLVHEKRQLKRILEETQLQLGSEIDSLKNKLTFQQEKSTEQNHLLMARINELLSKSLSDSENYHERVNQFRSKLGKLQAQIGDKQNIIERNKKSSQIREKQLNSEISDLNISLQKTKRQLSDQVYEKEQLSSEFERFKTVIQNQVKRLHEKLNQTQVKLQQSNDKLARQLEDHSGNKQVLKIQVQALKKTISVLQNKLSDQQRRHATEMKDFSSNSNEKLEKLRAAQRKSLDELENSKSQQINTLNSRIQKYQRQKDSTESELKRYIQMYRDLEKYFKDPHDGALFQEKSKNSIYEVLRSADKSSIHIF